jgi:hypothetical protein
MSQNIPPEEEKFFVTLKENTQPMRFGTDYTGRYLRSDLDKGVSVGNTMVWQ